MRVSTGWGERLWMNIPPRLMFGEYLWIKVSMSGYFSRIRIETTAFSFLATVELKLRTLVLQKRVE
jgi:hypothetical protein